MNQRKTFHLRSQKENIDLLMFYLLECFDPRKHPQAEIRVQFLFQDRRTVYSYYIHVNRGRATLHEGSVASPALTIKADLLTWYKIATHRAGVLWPLLTGKIRMVGPVSVIRMYFDFFNMKAVKTKARAYLETTARKDPAPAAWRKPSQVLVINGSPSTEQGLTHFYLSPLLRGMEAAGAKSEVISLYDAALTVEACRGCWDCWYKQPGVCRIHDDVPEIMKKIFAAELVLFAVPVYFETFPAKVKALVDRHFSLLRSAFIPYRGTTFHPVRVRANQNVALFTLGGFAEEKHFQATVDAFQAYTDNCHMRLRAVLCRPGAELLYEVPGIYDALCRVLQALESAGRQLVEKGEITAKTTKQVKSWHGFPMKHWRDFINFYWSIVSGRVNKS